VVTPERFASGLTWEEWLQAIRRNRDKFEYNYQETVLTPEDVAALRELVAAPDGPAKVLALAEDWCPDVFRGLPVMAKMAQAAGMELRIFFRDQNLDIMDEFLKDGQFRSIPTFVFYTRDTAISATGSSDQPWPTARCTSSRRSSSSGRRTPRSSAASTRPFSEGPSGRDGARRQCARS
jgi:thiol-disulfide isomerase/thioredoxin